MTIVGTGAKAMPMRAGGVLLLAAFLVGLGSAPIRSCISHPGHSGGSHDRAPAPMHASTGHGAHAPEGQEPATGHVGCDCLGLCQVQHAPLQAGYTQVRSAPGPAPSAAVRVAVVVGPRLEILFPVPLARPPPERV